MRADSLSGTDLRSTLSLRSACFAIAWRGGQFVITTRGYGHGVGLSQHGARAMAAGGVLACAQIVVNMFGSNAEHAKDLAYRLYTVAERKGWAQEAYAYNALVVAWQEIQSKALELKNVHMVQGTL